MATYNSKSPWHNTEIVDAEYLGLLEIRPVPAQSNDIEYTIEPQYTYRPDLLAYDLYGDRNLWWVFAQRNMDVIKDPIYDMVPGTKIYLPQGTYLTQTLGF